MRFTATAIAMLASAVALGAQVVKDEEVVWRDFINWYKAAPPSGNPLAGYPAALHGRAVSQPEIDRRMTLLARLLGERSDWVETYYDKTFRRPVTGNPARDGFNSAPSELLAAAVKGLPRGDALDAGMGQGRNAVYLASQGWRTAGFDISGEAVAASRANAVKAGVCIDVVKAGYDGFDFGRAKWDLIVLTFAWAPVTDPAFVSRLRASLRPGGRVVFEHFIDDPAQPRPAVMHALQPGQLRSLFSDFRIDHYAEETGVGDWGGPGHRLVRMVAVKPAP